METVDEANFNFSIINISCKMTRHPSLDMLVMDTVLSIVIVLTVVLNMLVIIAISHFRQLHTTTNLLLLSLAVADFFVGLLLMPALLVNKHGCIYLCDLMCTAIYFLGYVFVSVSLGSMVLISIDRYIAVCEPMFYTTRVTLTRIKLCVCLCWIFSCIHGGWILRDFLFQPNIYDHCVGDCVVVTSFFEGLIDIIFSLFVPILIIATLYLRVFAVAVSQARAMRSHITSVTFGHPKSVIVGKSEIKAARTLGIVVMVFLLCSCPYYFLAFAAESNVAGSLPVGVELWFLYLNSSFNPVMYVFFYPWFRKAIQQIITLQILKPGSRELTVQ